jgi:hypothetical protein
MRVSPERHWSTGGPLGTREAGDSGAWMRGNEETRKAETIEYPLGRGAFLVSKGRRQLTQNLACRQT